MTVITYRPCIVCGVEMKCTRSTKIACSANCTNKVHYRKKKFGITMEQTVELFRSELEENPNEI